MSTTVTKAQMKKMGILNLVERITALTDDASCFFTPESKPFTTELANRLGLTPMQALLTAVFVDQCDDNRIRYRDIAQHFDMRTVSIMAVSDVIDSLVTLGIVKRRHDSDGEVTYRMPYKVVESLKKGIMPEPEQYDNLTAAEFIDTVSQWLSQRGNDELDDEDLSHNLEDLINKNMHLHIAQELKSFNMSYSTLLLYLVMSIAFIDNHDDRLMRCDINDYFGRNALRAHLRALESGEHELMKRGLIEFSCENGRIDNNIWRLTDFSKREVYAELNLKTGVNVSASMTKHDDIIAKQMFYTPTVTNRVGELTNLLSEDRMAEVLRRLAEKGMRKGFACLFYGAPGTGKTETVLQLARMTGRDIMEVDVPSIRDKWVGETEKNIQAVFDRYRKAVESSERAPILLFNEADALLTRRNEGATTGVDKMENAMQNIILQEMEKLEGIMIATTNLTGNLDPAFERRFLYKLEFEKPTATERRHIWQTMLTDLTDEQALELAKRFEFSGGQIENIARKRVVSDILAGREGIDMAVLIDSCKAELLNRSDEHRHIGF